MAKTPLLVEGMHGMGDNVHQRAVLRALMQSHSIWLETSWPCIYHDLVGPDLRLLRRPVALRTQLKNAAREAAKFNDGGPAPHHRMPKIHMTYGKSTVRPGGSILEAMFTRAGIPNEYANADYRLPIPDEWFAKLDAILQWSLSDCWGSGNERVIIPKPILVYRPLVARPEWRGSIVRNANADDYATVFTAIRDSFFVVSVADLEPTREWIVGPVLKPDLDLHKGELPFEALAALFARAACVYTSSGFGAVLAPAVGTPCISIQGGFEPASWHADGAKLAPFLGIDPIKPCACATSACNNPCDKKLNVPAAIEQVRDFARQHCGVSTLGDMRPVAEVFGRAEHSSPVPVRRGIPLRIGHPSLLSRTPILRRPGVKA